MRVLQLSDKRFILMKYVLSVTLNDTAEDHSIIDVITTKNFSFNELYNDKKYAQELYDDIVLRFEKWRSEK
jgi:hypothetical protein